jgi:glycosyltransferase involved in cell wall biosynthesis
MKSVLIVQRSAALDGSAHSGLLLANGLREAGWSTHVAFGFEGAIIERYDAAGHETHVLPHKNWLRRGRTHQFAKDVYLEWKTADTFETLVQDLAPEGVYLNTIVSLAGAVAARRTGAHCIWHLREMFSDVGGEMHAPDWARPLVRGIIHHHADRLVANSRATARNMLGEGANEAAIVPNAARAAFFQENRSPEEARAALGLPLGPPVIGVPGTLRPMKGHPFFFDAIASLLRRRDEVCVAVTGEGASDFTHRLKKQVLDLGIQDQVEFLGWVDDMPAFYRACDLVCVPSRAEPFGRTAIEAFAVGTPVVASAVGGLQDIIEDGDTGLLVPYGNEEALTGSLRRLLEAPDLRHTLSANARQEGESKYHERVYKKRVAQLVDDVVNSKRGAAEDIA